MASPSDMVAAIQPASTQYGDRQTLEQGLRDMGGGTQPGAGPVPGQSPVTPAPTSRDPLGALLAGKFGKDSKDLTDGLTLGPGAGPAQNELDPDEVVRLRLLVENAKTPMLRYFARQALRRRLYGLQSV